AGYLHRQDEGRLSRNKSRPFARTSMAPARGRLSRECPVETDWWGSRIRVSRLGQLVNPACNRVKLRSLQIATLGPCNLPVGCPSRRFSADDVAEGHALVRQGDAVRALAGATVAVLAGTGPRLPAEELIVNRQVRPADRGRRIAKT